MQLKNEDVQMVPLSKPYFSIVMPVYNQENYLTRAVQSVINQTFTEWELILIDDGSTDNSGHLVDEFANSDPRIVPVHQENQWIYASYNRGVQLARGHYITFASSDDFLENDALHICYQYGNQYDVDIIFMNVVSELCDEKQNILAEVQGSVMKDEFVIIGQDNVRQHWINIMSLGLTRNPVNCYKSELIKKYKFRNDVYGADWLMNTYLSSSVKSVACHPKNLYHGLMYTNANDTTNASTGKFYVYEHEMFNEFYIEYVDRFKSWSLYDDTAKSYFAQLRLSLLDTERTNIFYAREKLSITEQIQRLVAYFDDIVFYCAHLTQKEMAVEHLLIETCQKVANSYSAKDRQAQGLLFGVAFTDLLSAFGSRSSLKYLNVLKTFITHTDNVHRVGVFLYRQYAIDCNAKEDVAFADYLLQKENFKFYYLDRNYEKLADTIDNFILTPFEDAEKYSILCSVFSLFQMNEEASRFCAEGLQKYPDDSDLEKNRALLNAIQNW